MKNEHIHIDEELFLKVLEHRASEQEKEALNNWTHSSDTNAEIFKDFKKVFELTSLYDDRTLNWEQIVLKRESGAVKPAYIELPEKKAGTLRFNSQVLMKMAAVFLLVVSVAIVFKVVVFDPEQITISGYKLVPGSPFVMSDGSQIYLNGDSKISFDSDFGKKHRSLTLVGEAFFEVEKNENIPFRISTQNTTTTVLGTNFNVYSDSLENVKVSVVTGWVEFASKNSKSKVQLGAGEQGSYHKGAVSVERQSFSNQNFLAWKTGILRFQDTPVDEAFAELSLNYRSVFVYKHPSGELPSITTIFDNESLGKVLEELNLLLNTHHETRNDTIYFSPER